MSMFNQNSKMIVFDHFLIFLVIQAVQVRQC